MSTAGVFILGIAFGSCMAVCALVAFGDAVTLDAAVSVTDAVGIAVNVTAVLLIPFLLAKATEQRGAWVPRTVDDLETVARLARDISATYESASARPLTAEQCSHLVQTTVDARRALRSCESRVKALAQKDKRRATLTCIDACQKAVLALKIAATAGAPTPFPSDDFSPTQDEISKTAKAAQLLEDTAYRAIGAL